MSDVVYRPAKREDFLEMNNLIRSAFDDLLKERGFWDISPFASSRLPPLTPTGPFPWFELGLKEDQNGFWVAEVDSKLAGFTLSWGSEDHYGTLRICSFDQTIRAETLVEI
jgi:hypothetical protein